MDKMDVLLDRLHKSHYAADPTFQDVIVSDLLSQSEKLISEYKSVKQRIAELEEEGNRLLGVAVEYETLAETQYEAIINLKAELKRKDEALGFGEAWPLPDVLLKLVESTEYLLDVKNYDKVGWEEVSHCTKLGRQYIDKINSVIAEQALKEKP